MAFSFFKNVIGGLVPGYTSREDRNDGDDDGDDDESVIDDDEARRILDKITGYQNLNEEVTTKKPAPEKLLGDASSKKSELKTDRYVCHTGTITYMGEDFGLIDGQYYFDADCIGPHVTVKKNDEVNYLTLQASSNSTPRVFKITPVNTPFWDTNDVTFSPEGVKEYKAMNRIITGKIVEIQDREFFVLPQKLWCNMDKIDMYFTPVLGDYVSLEASVTLNKKVANLSGDILKVLCAKPVLIRSGSGRVSFWVNGKNEGLINGYIYFEKSVCSEIYMPCLGDLVLYEAIESDQGKGQLRWRALWVKPDKLRIRQKKEKKIFQNKKGIVIKQSLSIIELLLNETKEATVEVINRSKENRTLIKVKIRNPRESFLTIEPPPSEEQITLKPNDRIKYTVKCEGKTLGCRGELMEFQFEKFKIAKSFEVNVLNEECMSELLCEGKVNSCDEKKNIKRIKDTENSELILFGERPYDVPRFPKLKSKKKFEVPRGLWELMLGPGNIPKPTNVVIKQLRESMPFFSTMVNAENYSIRFHTLLHLEELALKLKFTSYDMNEATFEKREDFMCLKVPGLEEGRPSILAGDRVVATSWKDSKRLSYVGFIHKTGCDYLVISFHQNFHSVYSGEKCEVQFNPNLGNFIKSHEAVDRALKHLGKDWLFPSSAVEKPDRISFEISQGPWSTVRNSSSETTQKKKQLVWVNTKLNERQQMAVMHFLRGRTRPLPYILFGPPGTGKTTTVVEMIVQVHRLMSDSKMLVCGPSNSSADLVTEYLIDTGLYKPGELVRLYAFNRFKDGHISEKLMPYSVCYTSAECIDSTHLQIKGSRITVGTFSAVGDLHTLTSSNLHFSHVFIDEAGQMTEPEALIPASFLQKEYGQLLLAGDTKQLGPVLTSPVAEKFDFDISLMERLISKYPYRVDRTKYPTTSGFNPLFVTKLTYNYRSLPEIISLPNQLFYDSDLVPMLSEKNSIEGEFLRRIDISIPKRTSTPAIIFHGVIGKNLRDRDSPSWYNSHEILQAMHYLKKIYDAGLTADDVGIVTPYSKQVQKFRSMLSKVNLAVPKTGTVNSFQGQEKHVIILSTVRSCIELMKKDVMYSLGFVASPRRLNVALTRARTLLVIIGNPNLLRADPYWERVIDYCLRTNSYLGCNVKSAFTDLHYKDRGGEEEDGEEDEEEVEEIELF